MRLPRPKTVYARAFLVLLASGVITQGLMIAMMVGFSPQKSPEALFTNNLHLYFSYLVDDLAKDPTLENAQQVLQGTRFDVRAEGAVSWDTVGKPVPPKRAVASKPAWNLLQPEWDGVRPIFRYVRDTSRGRVQFTLLAPSGPILHSRPVRFGLFMIMLATVFIVASFRMRRILQPISDLSSAFEKVKQGTLNVSLPALQNDELGRLSRSFNEMSAAIRFLIEDKERLFTELSHEFRAPIARASAANALVDDVEIRDSVEKDLKELDALIHAQLTAAKLEAGSAVPKVEPVDLYELLEDVRTLFPQALNRIEVEDPGLDMPVTCEAEARSLRTLFRNLVENALKYSPADKTVHVKIGQEGDRAFVAVADQGAGISDQEQKQVFEPFFRGNDTKKTKESGYGLGLALCRRIINAHGGELRIQSAVGKGTTISVLVPRTFQPRAIEPGSTGRPSPAK